MSTRRILRLRAKTGTYTDRQSGQEKNSYMSVGCILERDDGSRMYKLDAVPVNFDGWLYEGDLESTQQPKAKPQEQRTVDPDHSTVLTEDDIPF